MRTLVISDIHVGDARYSGEGILYLLQKQEVFDRLIINGDLADLWLSSPEEVKKDVLIKYLIDLAVEKPVIWVRGEHDWEAKEKIVLPNIQIVDEIILCDNNKNIYIVHGNSVYNNQDMAWYHKMSAKINYLIYRLIGKNLQVWLQSTNWYGRYIKNKRRELLNLSRCELVIMGHTHRIAYMSDDDGRELLDVGSTMFTRSYVIIENGDVWLGFRNISRGDYE